MVFAYVSRLPKSLNDLLQDVLQQVDHRLCTSNPHPSVPYLFTMMRHDLIGGSTGKADSLEFCLASGPPQNNYLHA